MAWPFAYYTYIETHPSTDQRGIMRRSPFRRSLRQFYPEFSQKTQPPGRGMVCVFCRFNLWFIFCPFAAMMYTISCFCGPCYNGPRLDCTTLNDNMPILIILQSPIDDKSASVSIIARRGIASLCQKSYWSSLKFKFLSLNTPQVVEMTIFWDRNAPLAKNPSLAAAPNSQWRKFSWKWHFPLSHILALRNVPYKWCYHFRYAAHCGTALWISMGRFNMRISSCQSRNSLLY